MSTSKYINRKTMDKLEELNKKLDEFTVKIQEAVLSRKPYINLENQMLKFYNDEIKSKGLEMKFRKKYPTSNDLFDGLNNRLKRKQLV